MGFIVISSNAYLLSFNCATAMGSVHREVWGGTTTPNIAIRTLSQVNKHATYQLLIKELFHAARRKMFSNCLDLRVITAVADEFSQLIVSLPVIACHIPSRSNVGSGALTVIQISLQYYSS